ncbi:lysostaphin resistance A-like protein [Candidatus Neomarinimicrobiota bacterium]
MIKNIFVNPSENRLRTGWRILIFIIIFLAIAKILNILIKLLGGPPEDKILSELLKSAFLIIVTFIAVFICRKFIDKKSFKSFGLEFKKNGLTDLLIGFLISGLLISMVFLALNIMGYVEIENFGYDILYINTIITSLLWFFIIGISVSWFEELTFRGYLLQNLTDGIGIKWAALLSSVIFGLLHLLNPNASVLPGIIIILITFLLVLGWLRTGQLWIPFGLHAGWNFFMGPIFGFPVSGMVEDSLLKLTITGPEWITGGDFGPEGGFLVLPIIGIGFILLFVLTKGRKDTPWIQFKL